MPMRTRSFGAKNAAVVRSISALALMLFACSEHPTKVEFFTVMELDTAHEFASSERRTIETIARQATTDVRQFLPALPKHITIRVHAGPGIPETGEGATASAPDTVVWVVDPNRPGGVEAVARAWLRASLFHELHHLVRDATRKRTTILDLAVSEGLATAFERDFAGATVPWGDYPSNVDAWLEEIRALPSTTPRKDWLGHHPDGRRWIALKVGTYLADRAAKTSGKSPADLVSASTEEVIALGSTVK
jgi:hypothetical protein